MNGFVKRTFFTGIPVVVEYELTKYSNTLKDVMRPLSEWGAMHRETIKKGLKTAIQYENEKERECMPATGGSCRTKSFNPLPHRIPHKLIQHVSLPANVIHPPAILFRYKWPEPSCSKVAVSR